MHFDVQSFWDAVLRQDAGVIRSFFQPDAWVRWHNTNEHFSVEDFIQANCEYPGQWTGEIERIVTAGNVVVTSVHVHSTDGKISCHATSFIHVEDGKIASMDEYWGDDGPVPAWRAEKRIGTKIKD